MRNPNGYGTVAKLSGKRRRPYIVKKTVGWNDKGQPVYDIIGYTETREKGNMLLAEYNREPWDVDRAKITLGELFALWKEKKAPRLGKANRRSLCSAYNHCAALYRQPYKTIRSYQMQDTIDLCGKSASTQANIKSLWGHLDRFALELDIINRCYSELLTSAPMPPTNRVPFTEDEIKTVWEHASDAWVDSILVLLYSGWRISELLGMRKSDVDLDVGTMKGGVKTEAGKNRIVPIHPRIRPIIESRMTSPGDYLFSRGGKKCSDSQYRVLWRGLMDLLHMQHTPHECRHTFRSRLDAAGANQKCCDLLMGHLSKDTGNRVYNHKTLSDLVETIALLT